MFPPARIVAGDQLPDSDTVSRYCSPSNYDLTEDEPKLGAFQLTEAEKRGNCPSSSVNRLQFFQQQSLASAVDCVRQEFIAYRYKLSKNGRFIAFGVRDAKDAALRKNLQLVFRYTPDPPMYSHSSIYNLPVDGNLVREVATAMKRQIRILHTAKAVL